MTELAWPHDGRIQALFAPLAQRLGLEQGEAYRMYHFFCAD